MGRRATLVDHRVIGFRRIGRQATLVAHHVRVCVVVRGVTQHAGRNTNTTPDGIEEQAAFFADSILVMHMHVGTVRQEDQVGKRAVLQSDKNRKNCGIPVRQGALIFGDTFAIALEKAESADRKDKQPESLERTKESARFAFNRATAEIEAHAGHDLSKCARSATEGNKKRRDVVEAIAQSISPVSLRNTNTLVVLILLINGHGGDEGLEDLALFDSTFRLGQNMMLERNLGTHATLML